MSGIDYKGRVFRETRHAYLSGKRLIANKGGTRSGKTYSTMCLLCFIAAYAEYAVNIDIVSESIPHLKRGALKDFEDIMEAMRLEDGVDYVSNLSDHRYTFRNGVQMQFFSADDWGKVKGSKRDILFINESNRLPHETFRQLAVRTSQTIFMDWNPDSEYWYEQQGYSTRETTQEIHSTYLDNPYLTDIQIAEIEANKGDTNWWKVYGLGETGTRQGVIYTNWTRCKAIPNKAKHIGRGLDFGFASDPTAIVDVYLSNGELYIDELCYQKGMTNDKIAERLRGLEGWTVADSAEPKSIQEIHNYGIRIEPCVKGQDSIRAGIDVVSRYRLNVTEKSLNLQNELRNYRWKEDKITGETLNEPVDKFNHAMDALRYICAARLAQMPRVARPRTQLMDV